MRKCSLLLLIIYEVVFCSLVSKNNKKFDATNSVIPLIGNYGYKLPIETWCYLMDFLDCQTGQSMALVCRDFYHASTTSKRLHLERVQKWMIKEASDIDIDRVIQSYISFDMQNSCIEIHDSLLRNMQLIPPNQNVLLTVMRGMNTLILPYKVLNAIFENKEDIEFQKVKELTLMKHYIQDQDKIFDFQLIHTIFPDIDVLQLYINLGYSEYLKIPFTYKDVFSAMPLLDKLVIRIFYHKTEFFNPEEFVELLDVLHGPRVELILDAEMLSEKAVIWAFKMLDSQSRDKKKPLKMKERAFFSFDSDNLEFSYIICENAKQIHSLSYHINNESTSLAHVLSTVGIFTQLNKLFLEFINGFEIANFIISELRPFNKLVDFELSCYYSECKHLLLSLHVLFPNLTKIDVFTVVPFDLWSKSLLQLRKLEKIYLAVGTTREGLDFLFKSVADGIFPRLKELKLPNLLSSDNSNISDDCIATSFKKMVFKYPSLKLMNEPSQMLRKSLSPNQI